MGSGTRVADGLVLTAAHVVFDDGKPSDDIRLSVDGGPEVEAQVAWPAAWTEDSDQPDVALVEFRDPPASSAEPTQLRWGRLTTSALLQGCQAIGYPRAAVGDSNERTPDQLSADLSPVTGSRVVNAHVTTSIPLPIRDKRSPWGGASGAGLFHEGALVAVLVADHLRYERDRLVAEPVDDLLGRLGVRQVLNQHGVDPHGESVEWAGALASPWTRYTGGFGEAVSPSGLLRPDAETIPFHGREETLTDLIDWCHSDGLVRFRLITGPGGQGKTRLARELAQRLDGQPYLGTWSNTAATWVCGSLLKKPSGLERIAERVVPALVVIDYAETRPGTVRLLLESCQGADTSFPIRVILLARTAGDWWAELMGQLGVQTTESNTSELGGIAPSGSEESGPVSLSARFAEVLATLRPEVDWATLAERVKPEQDDSVSGPDSPLTTQLSALTALLDAAWGESLSRDPRPEERLLHHEKTYWREVAAQSDVGLSLSDQTLHQVAAAVAWFGGPSQSEAQALIRALTCLGGQTEDVLTRVGAWLTILYPSAPEEHWGSVQPDRVAEFIIAAAIAQYDMSLSALFAVASEQQLRRAITVLGRMLVNSAVNPEQLTEEGVKLSV